MTKKLPSSEFNFEQAIKDLETIASLLQDSSRPLQESISMYSNGKSLLKQCQKYINESKLIIENIDRDFTET